MVQLGRMISSIAKDRGSIPDAVVRWGHSPSTRDRASPGKVSGGKVDFAVLRFCNLNFMDIDEFYDC